MSGSLLPKLGYVQHRTQTVSALQPGNLFTFPVGGAPPTEDQIVTLGNAATIGVDAAVPTVEGFGDQIVNLGNAAEMGADVGVPTVVVGADQIVTLGNAATIGVDSAIPTITVPIRNNVFLANAARSGVDASIPEVTALVNHQVTLDNAATSGTDAKVGTVIAGADAIVTLGNAATSGIDARIGPVVGEITHFVNLGNAATSGIDASIPTTEGVSDLPPVITDPTDDQIYTFGVSGTLPAPPHDIGTGENPQWSLPVDGFGTQPGVMTWSINANTGDITYQINQLNSDPDQQALNTKGPYTVTRRLTTTIANADETFTVAVNVGNYTLQMTPGTKPVLTWDTKTPAARGLEPTKDPSARVTQTYTVT